MNKLQNTLTKMNSLNIKSNKLLLSHTILHEEFFLNLDHFITNTIFRSKKNLMHLSELTCKYGVNIDDIRFDCLERCVSKLDLILTIDLECQIPYIYKICNNIIVDYFRKTVQYVLTTVSLNQVLLHNNDSDSLRHVKTIEDYIIDSKINIELTFIAKAKAIELLDKHSNNMDSLLCHVASKIAGDKPSKLAQVLISEGNIERTLFLYLQYTKKKWNIKDSEIPKLPHVKKTGLNKLLSEGASVKVLSAKISNILHRTK